MNIQKKMTKKEFRNNADAVLVNLNLEVLPFTDESEGEKKLRLSKAEKNPLYFCRVYLPHYFHHPPASFHYELIKHLENGSADSNGDVMAEGGKAADAAIKPIVIAAPREFAKTTVCSFGYVLHQICFGKRRFIIIGSDTEELASDLTGYILLELLYNERIRHDFGVLIKSSGPVDDFVTCNDIRVKARGRGQRLRGLKHRQWRPDLVILDDLENDLNVRNPNIVRQILEWITSAVYPSMEASGSLMIIGTILRRGSALDSMLNSEAEPYCHFSRQVYRAITEEGKSLWEARHPLSKLLRQKQLMGITAFNQEKMNEPVHEAGVFCQEWIRYYHPDSLKDKELIIFGYFDPSIESGASSDYKAMLTVGLAVREMVFYVMDAFIQKTTLENTLRTIANRFKEYGHEIIGVEDNLFQRLLLTEFDRLGKEMSLSMPIKGVTNRVAKEARIISLSPLLERGKVRFIRGQSDQELLIEQLLYFPSKTINDDGPDALEGCLRMYKDFGIKKIGYETVEKRHFAKVGAY